MAITDAYDLRNRRISKTYPDGSAETWGHDAVGNPVSRRTPSGKLATSLYDNRNRLVSTDWSDATPDVAFAYDAAGRVVAATSSASGLSYLYNAAGELVFETQEIRVPQAQPARTVGYRYDADGNRAALVYPDGSETTYGYTARNQLATVSAGGPPPLATYGYDLAGNRALEHRLHAQRHREPNRPGGILRRCHPARGLRVRRDRSAHRNPAQPRRDRG